MDFLNYGIPFGRYFGINVRVHFTFFLFAFYRVSQWGNIGLGLAYILGLYLCILLHEFGHALAARWCDGEANDILLWPLGGLAFVRPAWHPTAHLITTVAGPFVTFVLWILFHSAVTALSAAGLAGAALWFCVAMRDMNLLLLIFNLIPAFPMDGGRILRDTLWHWMRAETATLIAVRVSQVIAVAAIAWAVYSQDFWLLFLAGFILMQTGHERHIVAMEAGGQYGFSVRERLRRGFRQRAYRQAVRDNAQMEAAMPFHRCATCGRTERDAPEMEFRVCTDCSNGQEYCPQHLHSHTHV